jgi:hypothetical protein
VARSAARTSTEALQVQATQLAAATADPAVQEQLRTIAQVLAAQAAALTSPAEAAASATPSAQAQGTPTPAQDTPTPAQAAEAPSDTVIPSPGGASAGTGPALAATLDTFLPALARSGTSALVAATTADPPMSRLLAAAGTGQLLQARALAAAVQAPVPPLPDRSTLSGQTPEAGPPATPPAADNGPAGSPAATAATAATAAATPPPAATATSPASANAAGQGSPSAGACPTSRAADPGVNADAALTAAARAEQELVYAYQVAVPRLPAPAAAQAREILTAHQTALIRDRSLLAAACLAVPATEPGYALPAGFAADPAPALGRLEDQLSVLYAQLAALSPAADGTGSPRSEAIWALLNTSRWSWLWSGTIRVLPGMDD